MQNPSQIDTTGVADSLSSGLPPTSSFEVYVPGLESRIDTLITVGEAVQADGGSGKSIFALIISGLALLVSATLAYFNFQQYRIINRREQSYAAGYTFIQNKQTPPQGTPLEEYVARYIYLYLQLTNTGDVAIDDIWIKIPHNLKIVTPSTEGKDFHVRVLRVREPVLPEERITLFFDDELFFQGNAELVENTESSFTIAFKGPKEDAYSVLDIPFKVSRQQSTVESSYKLSMDNAIKLENQDVETFSEVDFDELPT